MAKGWGALAKKINEKADKVGESMSKAKTSMGEKYDGAKAAALEKEWV